jgi:spore maturation protein CgeB
LRWPKNVRRTDHLPPAEEHSFYCSQRYLLNLTRDDMLEAGYSPSLRLFEAAACGVPVISDQWPGLEEFFVPGEEILLADSGAEVLGFLTDLDDARRAELARAARERVVTSHSSLRRAQQFDEYVANARLQLPPRVHPQTSRQRAAARR